MPRSTWILTLGLLAASTRAQAQEPVPFLTKPTPPAGFLRVEPDFWWGFYRVTLKKDGQEVGPGFLMLGLSDAVKGFPEAEDHAMHAKVWSALDLAFVLITTGLLVADLVTYPDNHGGDISGWPDFVPRSGQNNQNAALGLGWFFSLNLAFFSRYMTYSEMMTSINSYNYDLFRRGPR